MLQWQQCCIIKLTRPSVPIPSLRPRHTSLRFHTRPAPNTTPPPSSVHPPLSIHSTRVSASSCQARRSGQSSGMAGPRRASPFLWGAKLQGRRKNERVLEGGGACAHTHSTNTHTLNSDVIWNDIILWKTASRSDGLASSSELKRENKRRSKTFANEKRGGERENAF